MTCGCLRSPSDATLKPGRERLQLPVAFFTVSSDSNGSSAPFPSGSASFPSRYYSLLRHSRQPIHLFLSIARFRSERNAVLEDDGRLYRITPHLRSPLG